MASGKKKKTTKKSDESARTSLDASARIVVLHGSEAHLRSLRTDELRAAIEAETGDVDVIRYDGARAEIADVLDECRNFGLMQARKLVIVDEADKFIAGETNRRLLERYAQAPADQTTLVLRAERWRKGKIDGLIERVGAVVRCDELTPAQAVQWVVRHSKQRADTPISEAAARALVERTGPDLGRLESEVSKLASAAGPGGRITPDLVDELVGRTREEEVWTIQARLVSGDPDQAVRAVREALGPSRQPEALVSFAMINLGQRLHSAASLFSQRMPAGQVVREARIFGAGRDAILDAARRVDPTRAADLLAEAVAVDVRLKTGAPNPARSFEILAVRFASLCAGSADERG